MRPFRQHSVRFPRAPEILPPKIERLNLLEGWPQNSFLIFDRALQRRRLARALAARPADFLLARAAGEIVERLSAVTRRFSAIADIGTPLPLLAEALATAYPAARITRLAPRHRRQG